MLGIIAGILVARHLKNTEKMRRVIRTALRCENPLSRTAWCALSHVGGRKAEIGRASLLTEPLFKAIIKDVLEIAPNAKEEGLAEFAARGYLHFQTSKES